MWLLRFLPKVFLRFLPKEQKDLVTLGMRIVSRLDSGDERKQAVNYGIEMLKDGKVTVTEWARFGSRLGILKGKSI
jgi:hypothetical protein